MQEDRTEHPRNDSNNSQPTIPEMTHVQNRFNAQRKLYIIRIVGSNVKVLDFMNSFHKSIKVSCMRKKKKNENNGKREREEGERVILLGITKSETKMENMAREGIYQF